MSSLSGPHNVYLPEHTCAHPHTRAPTQTPLFPELDVVQKRVSVAEEGCGPTVAVEGGDDEEQEEKAAAAGQRTQNHRSTVQRQAAFPCGACRRCSASTFNIRVDTIKNSRNIFTFLAVLTHARGGRCARSFCGGGGGRHGGLWRFF